MMKFGSASFTYQGFVFLIDWIVLLCQSPRDEINCVALSISKRSTVLHCHSPRDQLCSFVNLWEIDCAAAEKRLKNLRETMAANWYRKQTTTLTKNQRKKKRKWVAANERKAEAKIVEIEAKLAVDQAMLTLRLNWQPAKPRMRGLIGHLDWWRIIFALLIWKRLWSLRSRSRLRLN